MHSRINYSVSTEAYKIVNTVCHEQTVPNKNTLFSDKINKPGILEECNKWDTA